ncbi:putative disease resistance protein RGA4 [Cinnamomum micranthum f. kanehirae]|uniref:Putative disease resistance protein RGA4 n=1 Tax=Cinnamomum micranthum f. kanehirae TaxID=337451 RepID=A0A443N8U3_9MAGN|nr:putative disease resistance protein RGA4 [Cinnamomum micranthum f. kanehirae]
MATDALVSFVVEELCSIAKDRLSSLFGVEKEVDELSNTFLDIQAVLEDAESHQVTNERVQRWLWELKEVAYEVQDILDEWVTDALVLKEENDETHHPKRMRFSFPSPFQSYKQVKLQYDIGKRIREITKRLSEISIKKNRFNLRELNTREVRLLPDKEERQTGSLIDETEIFGRDDFKQSIIEQLVSEEKSVSTVSIVGMGGLGKTALAQLVYNDSRVKAYFEKRIWVCVSDPFDVNKIATEVIKSMGEPVSNNANFATLQGNLHEAVSKTRFLLVLDDVWNENHALWEKLSVPLKDAAQGSKVVVTTRSHRVAVAMDTPRINVHELGILSNSDCWEVFHSRALKGTEEENCQELTKIGEKIVERCKGVPLAIRAVGSLLRGTREKWYWEHVLENEIWEWNIVNDDIHKDSILPALLLSYDNLPSRLKRCFSFCSVFPKDHVIEKDELVKLWMAHGIIKSKKAKKDDTEGFGEMYFDYLLTHSLFQDAEKDEYGNIVRCKMHDLVHDLAKFVSSGEYCSMEAGDTESCSAKCHHLSLHGYKNVSSIPSILCNVKRLHTLLLSGYSDIEAVLDTLFNPLRYLRALDLSGAFIANLPSSIGKLKHLRYLNLGGLEIVELPESVTDLCNLQTLKLNYCKRLRLLPNGISKMVKLRYLEIEGTDDLAFLPNGLGRLTALRTLCKLPVGDENRGCKIRELKDLNLLRGELNINNLERVMNVNDASDAELHKKIDLYVLSLCCNDKSDEEWRKLGDDDMKRMGSVLEGLRPHHSNLKELKIKNYAGSMFPSWLYSDDSGFSSLVEVVLENCRKCMLLPGLGKLRSLKYLKVIRADEVKVVGCEFYGIVNDARWKGTIFPKLEKLHFESMLNWEEWKLTQEYGEVMPSLEKLKIINCKKLKATLNCLPRTLRKVTIEDCNEVIWAPDNPLPHLSLLTLENVRGMSSKPLPDLPALMTLEINGFSCESLPSDGWGLLESLHTLKISYGPELASLPEGLGQLKALQTLEIWHCDRLSYLPEELGQLKALQTLEISCEQLLSLPEGLGQLKALQTLFIWKCQQLSTLPEGLGQLKALRSLSIKDCERLSSLPGGLGQLKALQTLSIKDSEQLSSLPEGLGQLKALQTLCIGNIKRLSSLPEGLGQLKALQNLCIGNIKRLSSLPEGLGQLEALYSINIGKCDELTSLFNGLGRFKALRDVHVVLCEKLRSLSDGLLQLEELRSLHVSGCPNLQSLFGGFEQLKSLHLLEISDCPQLRPLPNLQHLTALKKLCISNCPLVTERLEKEKGEDWCNLSHIRRIEIDRKVIKQVVVDSLYKVLDVQQRTPTGLLYLLPNGKESGGGSQAGDTDV